MSSQEINDFLTRQIFIERNIVTYRSLSRELKIHVNVAKNELATYHALAPFESQASKSAATYLLSGEALASHAHSYEDEDVNMDDDDISEDGDSDGDGDEVSRTRVMLVNERDLEVAKTQFARLDSIHVYSLAPSPIRDAGLLCTLTDAIRLVDGKQGSAIASVVGKVVGRNIQIKAVPTKGKAPAQPIAGPSKQKLANVAMPVTKAMEKATIKDPMKKEDVTKEKETKGAAKLTGKLDFSKAKAKETKKAEPEELKKAETKVEQKKKEVPVGSITKGTKSDKSSLKPGTDMRGKKRKSPMVMSDSEDDGGPSPRSKPVILPGGNVRVKKRTVLSDDEGEGDIPKPTRRPRKSARASEPVDSEAENEARALMDVDDDQVVRITRDTPVITKEDEEDEEEDVDQDVEMSDSTVPKPKPRKRREKKVIPVGSNGLKKKRVVKSRMMTDAKGYMVTEDYSSYESADENEEPEPKPKTKAKGKSSAKVKREEEEDSISTPPPPKLKPSKAKAPAKSIKTKNAQPKQKSLAGFFTAPKAKN